ncbi:MAG: aminopeptidase [Deltaproteobacteria bacterium]
MSTASRHIAQPVRLLRLLSACLLVALLSGCSTLSYVAQAAAGQWELVSAARPIPAVIADPKTSEQTRELLGEVERVRHFGWQRGLKVGASYQKYVQLDRDYPIWFVNASAPLAFRAKVFSFPIVGSFPGLAWFDKKDAEAFRDRLSKQGWDVNMRGVSAFSTGGYFADPIVWSMLSKSPGAVASLINTVLHESVHATVLIKDQQYFNESLASFIADTMTGEYLQYATGQALPPELRAYQSGKQFGQLRVKQFNGFYQELDAVYGSDLPDAEKYARKNQIIDRIVRELRLAQRPNNATLIGFRLYQVGGPNFSALFAACGNDWRRFLSAVSGVSTPDFGQDQSSEVGPVLDRLRERGCPTQLFPIEPFERSDWRWKTKQRRREEEQRERQTRVLLKARSAATGAEIEQK